MGCAISSLASCGKCWENPQQEQQQANNSNKRSSTETPRHTSIAKSRIGVVPGAAYSSNMYGTRLPKTMTANHDETKVAAKVCYTHTYTPVQTVLLHYLYLRVGEVGSAGRLQVANRNS
eukprot:4488961-Amphidinium_carterae.1